MSDAKLAIPLLLLLLAGCGAQANRQANQDDQTLDRMKELNRQMAENNRRLEANTEWIRTHCVCQP